MAATKLSISDRGERAIRKLGELTTRTPFEWKNARKKSKGKDIGAFHLVGSVIRDVARSITDQDSVKVSLHASSIPEVF